MTFLIQPQTPYGTTKVSAEPSYLFADDFDGTALDYVNKWMPVVTAGTGALTVSNSLATLSTGITASNAVSVNSKQVFSKVGVNFLVAEFRIKLEATALLTGAHRFWGFGTAGSPFASATPLTNATGFEIDTTGALNAVIYSGGTRVFSQVLVPFLDGNYHSYEVYIKPGENYWFVDSDESPVAISSGIISQSGNLPLRLHMVNSPTTPPASSPTMSIMDIGVGDSGHNSFSISDGVNPSFKAAVDPITKGLMVAYSDMQLDAFGRLRTSEPFLVFESIQKYDKQPLIWEEVTTGGGVGTHLPNESSTALTVGTVAGDSVIRQTKKYIPYTPARSQFVFMTGVLGQLKANVLQRIGYFDVQNGIFFEQNGVDLRVVLRTFTSGTVSDANFVVQANWNLDPLDGTGRSGYKLDTTKSNIMIFDMEWLGVGRVRAGFVIDGKVIWAHAFNNANVLSAVYMTTAKLPLRYEITNTGTTASSTTMKHTCGAVMNEGGRPTGGSIRSADMGVAGRAITAGTALPLMSIRLNSANIRASLQPLLYNVVSSANSTFYYALVINGTLTGATFATNLGFAQVDTAATAMTGGTIIDSGYISGTTHVANGDISDQLLWVEANMAGVSDTLTIYVANIATNGTFYGQLSYKEVV